MHSLPQTDRLLSWLFGLGRRDVLSHETASLAARPVSMIPAWIDIEQLAALPKPVDPTALRVLPLGLIDKFEHLDMRSLPQPPEIFEPPRHGPIGRRSQVPLEASR